jgi:hypothetical protein
MMTGIRNLPLHFEEIAREEAKARAARFGEDASSGLRFVRAMLINDYGPLEADQILYLMVRDPSLTASSALQVISEYRDQNRV